MLNSLNLEKLTNQTINLNEESHLSFMKPVMLQLLPSVSSLNHFNSNIWQRYSINRRISKSTQINILRESRSPSHFSSWTTTYVYIGQPIIHSISRSILKILRHTRHVIISYFHVTPSSSVFFCEFPVYTLASPKSTFFGYFDRK